MSCGVSSEGVYTYTMTLPFVSLSCGLRFGLPEFRRVFTSFFCFPFACVFLPVHSRRSNAARLLLSRPEIEYMFSRGWINSYI